MMLRAGFGLGRPWTRPPSLHHFNVKFWLRRGLAFTASRRPCPADAPTLSEALAAAEEPHKSVYITTPIFYVNAAPHIGHLHSALLADALNRYYRLLGANTVFSTGTDEHGLKIQRAASQAGVAPLELCNEVSGKFKALFDAADIGYTRFVRTTDVDHHAAVVALWNQLRERGLIYLGEHSGWYCVPDEAFLTAKDVEDCVGPDGEEYKVSRESRHRVEWVVEHNYKFRLSQFGAPLKAWLDTGAVGPRLRANEVAQLIGEGLQDLSVSRSRGRLKWGIATPGDDEHTIYVWLDALTNYLTCAGYCGDSSTPASSGSMCWPADYHIVGKDILKFHAMYWPAFLMGAGLEPPRRVIAHGHWTVDKVKMSKSLGNVVDPVDRMQRYGVDGLRYFLLKDGRLATDGDYSDARAVETINADLADTLGNILSRCTSKKVNTEQAWPSLAPAAFNDTDRALLARAQALPDAVDRHYRGVEFGLGILEVMDILYELNRYVDSNRPWALRQSQDTARRQAVLLTAMEVLRVAATLLLPIIPTGANRALDRLGVAEDQRTMAHIVQQGRDRSGTPLGPDSTPLFAKFK